MLHLNNRAMDSEVESRLEHMMRHTSDLLRENITSIQIQTSTIAQNELVRNGLIDTQERYRYLPVMFRSLGRVSGSQTLARVSLLDFMGNEIISNNVDPGHTIPGLAMNHTLEEGKDVLVLDMNGLLYATPIFIHGFVEGSIATSMNYSSLQDLFVDWDRLNYAVSLQDEQGNGLLTNLFYKDHAGSDQINNNPDWVTLTRQCSIPGLENYYLIVGLPHTIAYASGINLRNQMLISLGLALFFAMSAVIMSARMTARPIRQLEADVSFMAGKKDLSLRLPVAGVSEIQNLAQSFNLTLASLEQVYTSKKRQDQLLSGSTAVIYSAPPDKFQVSFISSNVYSILGYTSQDILDNEQWWLDNLHPEDREQVLETETRWYDSNAPHPLVMNYRFRHALGHWIWIEDRIQAIKSNDGKILEEIGSLVDISARKKAQEKIKINEEKYRSLVEQSVDMVFLHDLHGNIIDINQAAISQTGYSRQELLSMNVFDLHPDASSKNKIIDVWADWQPGESQTVEAIHKCKNDTHVSVEVTTGKISIGREHFILALVRDITQRKQAEQQLIMARDAAQAASKAKSEFLANMSHEIRTPMAGILGALDMLSSRVKDPFSQRIIAMTLESAGSLHQIINDILDLSKVEAGKMDIQEKEFNPEAIVHRVIELYSIEAQKKNIELIREIDSDLPMLVKGDPYRLEQVLNNLVSNAIKFTDRGTVTVSVRLVDHDHNSSEVSFAVEDTGTGIAEEFTQKIFDSFSQADLTYGKKHQGTGLGLTICKNLVHLMGGEITVSSRLNQGSIFTFSLPLSIVRQTPQQEQNSETALSPGTEPLPLRVLIAEDMALNQEYIQYLLNQKGYLTEIAENGRQAVDLFRQGRFDLILMDIQMPEMDGLEAMREIRKLESNPGLPEFQNSRIPVIALTAYAMNEDRERFIAAGMDGYVSKPVNPEILFEEINRLVKYPVHADSKSSVIAPEETEHQPAPEQSSLFDFNEIDEKYAGNRQFWQKMFTRFVDEELDSYIHNLKKAAEKDDMDNLFALAHKLKGGLGTLCASDAAEAAANLDGAVRNKEIEKIPEAMQELLEELKKVNSFRNSLSSP